MSNTQRFFNIQRFNNATKEIEPLQYRTIGYRRDRRTNNYILVYTNPEICATSRYARQEIVVLPHIFASIVPTAVKSDVYAGCIDVTTAQFRQLGFVIHVTKEVAVHEISA